MSNEKNTIYVGGLAEDITEKLLNDIFIVFGEITEIQMPIDYESQKHRGKRLNDLNKTKLMYFYRICICNI